MKSGGHALFIATQHGTHTHMHMQDGGRCSLLFRILESSPRDIQEQWAASDAAPGDQVQVLGPDLVRVRTDEHLYLSQGEIQVSHPFSAYPGR